jgi:hypothetical protein
MLTKSQVIESLKELPENFTIDELIDHLVFIQKVEIGIDQSNSGHVYSTDELRKKLDKWL